VLPSKATDSPEGVSVNRATGGTFGAGCGPGSGSTTVPAGSARTSSTRTVDGPAALADV
jgi:hypothetical protein